MPRFKRTRSKVDETDSESDGSETPTIGKRLNKRSKPIGNPPGAHRKLRSSPQKLMVYIVAAKLGAGRNLAVLSDLVEESTDYALAKNPEEADVIVTEIGMRQRLERSISAELIVSYRSSTSPCGGTQPTVSLGPETHRQTGVVGKVDTRGRATTI